MFWLNVSDQKPSVFFVSKFCFQTFTLKLILRPKILTISLVKFFFFFFFFFFFNFCLRKYFLFFLLNLNYCDFTTILCNFRKKKMKLLKICFQVTYPTDFSGLVKNLRPS